mmetsp:Transcript_46445/g.129250  ORF Transcript_46445/g.129250 Transcript_46445/m.129250 type:complete len:93 (+) Transcript_46445:135-413(+)
MRLGEQDDHVDFHNGDDGNNDVDNNVDFDVFHNVDFILVNVDVVHDVDDISDDVDYISDDVDDVNDDDADDVDDFSCSGNHVSNGCAHSNDQ